MKKLCEWLQKQIFLNVLQKHVFRFSAVLKRAIIMSNKCYVILQTSTFLIKSTEVVKKTRK